MKRGNKSLLGGVVILITIILISSTYLLVAQSEDSNNEPLIRPSTDSYDGYIIELKDPSILEKINELNQTAYNNQRDINQMSDLNPMKYWKIYFSLKPGDVPEKIDDYKTEIIENKESVKNKIKNKLKKDKVSYLTGNVIANPQKELVIKQEFENVYNGFAIQITDSEAEILRSLPEIKSIQPNLYVEGNLMDSVDQIKTNYSWIHGYTGKGVTIAIVDSGIDYNHPDFQDGKYLGGYDYINNDADPFDDLGHGTHVAGIAAGNGTLKGVAPDAKLYAYKVLNSNNSGSWSAIIAGINRAVDPNNDGDFSDHVDVISLSLGGDCKAFYGGYYSYCGPDDSVSTAVDNAVNNGVIVVVAAGNSGPSAATVWTPGTARKAITVGAVTKSNTMASFSSRGPVVYNNEDVNKPDVVAPGVNICSAKSGGPISYGCFDTRHMYGSGTSMATPHVTGLAALLKQKFPNYSPNDIKSLIKNTSDFLPEYIYSDQGAGLINVQKAMNVTDLTQPISYRLPLEFFNDQLLTYNIIPNNKAIFQINKTIFTIWKEDNSLYYSKLNSNGEILIYKNRISYDIYNQNNPSLIVKNNIPHVVWNDDMNLNNEIYYKKITNASAIENRITFSGFDSIKPQILDLDDSLGILFLKLTDDIYNLNYKKLDYNENILQEDTEVIQDIEDYNAIYYKNNIYLTTKDSLNNIKLLIINKNGNIQDTISIATGINPDITKFEDYETKVAWIDSQNILHVAIIDDNLKSIIDDKTISGTLDNPSLKVDKLNYTYVLYESNINNNKAITYSVIDPLNTIIVENEEITNLEDNSINPIFTIGSLNLLYETDNQLKLKSTDLKHSSPPVLLNNKILNLNAYGAIFEFNYNRLIKTSTLTIKDKDSQIIAEIINNTITSTPTFNADNLTSGTKYSIEINSIDLVGNSATHTSDSELNNIEFYTRTTSKIPELPTSLYGRVITTDNTPVEGVEVTASWTDVDDNNYTSTINTFTQSEANDLGDSNLVGYFRFNSGNIKAKKNSQISVSVPKDLTDPDPYVTSSPGRRAVQINEPIIISGNPPEITVNSPLEQTYTSDEYPIQLNFNIDKDVKTVTFSLNNQNLVEVTALQNKNINLTPIIGENTLTIEVTDITNLNNSKTITFTVQDISSPEVILDNPIYSQDLIRLSATVQDSLSPLKQNCQVCISQDGNCDTEWKSATNEFSENSYGGKCLFNINKESYDIGQYSYNFKISDTYDNENSGIIKIFTIDNTPPPEIPQIIIDPAPNKNELKITWQPSTEPNFKEYRIYRSSSPEELIKIITNKLQTEFIDTNLEENKIYTYRMTVVDEYNNENSGVSDSEKVSDITIPIITITSPEKYQLYNYKNIPLTFTVSEQSNCSININSNILPISNQIIAIEGLNSLQISCSDSENTGISEQITFTVDSIPPVKVTPGVRQRPGQKVLDVYWSSSFDSEKFYIYKSNQEFTNINQATLISTAYGSLYTDTDNIIVGNTYFYAILPEDNAGNINNDFDVVSKRVSDITAPEIILISPFSTTYNTKQIPLIFEASEQVQNCVYNLDNFIFNAINSQNITAQEGNHNIQVTCFDQDDNSGDSQTISFTVDTTPDDNQTIPLPTNETNQTIPPPELDLGLESEPFTLKITNPQNNIITNQNKIPVTYTTDKELESCEYIIDNYEIKPGNIELRLEKEFPEIYNPNRYITVEDIDNDGLSETIFHDYKNIFILDTQGNIKNTFYVGGPIASTISIADLDHDKDKELIFGDSYSNLYAYHHTGEIVEGWPVKIIYWDPYYEKYLNNSFAWSVPVIGDIDNDGDNEIIINPRLYYIMGFKNKYHETIYQPGNFTVLGYEANGTPINGWPIIIEKDKYTSDQMTSAPAIGDLDNNGDLEIVLTTRDHIYVFNHDGSRYDHDKNNIPDWPLSLCDHDECNFCPPNQTICYRYRDNICIYDVASKKYYYNGIECTHYFVNYWRHLTKPILADMDDDGILDIIVQTSSFTQDEMNWDTEQITQSTSYGKFYIFNPDSSIKSGFPILNQDYGYRSLYGDNAIYNMGNSEGIADIDNDGKLEYISQAGKSLPGSPYANHLFAINHDGSYEINFNEFIIDTDFSFFYETFLRLNDMNNDKQIDFHNYAKNPNKEHILAYDINNKYLNGFPLLLDHIQPRVINAQYRFKDIDNDGIMEIVVLETQYQDWNDVSTRFTKLVIYNTTIKDTPDASPWPVYAHDYQRTNNYNFVFNDIENCIIPGDEDSNGLADCLDPACPQDTICSKNNAKSCQSGVCKYRQGLPFDAEVNAFEGKNELLLICESTDQNKTSSNMISFIVDTDTRPDPILNLRVKTLYNIPFLSLSWDKSQDSNFKSYNIYKSDESFTTIENAELITQISDINTDSYVDQNLTPGETFYYAITAINQNNQENPSVTSVPGIVDDDGIDPDCSDSDGGFDIYEEGFLGSHFDACLLKDGPWWYDYEAVNYCTGNDCFLNEWYCKYNQENIPIEIDNNRFYCQYGCSNGACIKGPELEPPFPLVIDRPERYEIFNITTIPVHYRTNKGIVSCEYILENNEQGFTSQTTSVPEDNNINAPIQTENTQNMFGYDAIILENYSAATALDTSESCIQPGDEDLNGLADCEDPACPENTICSYNKAKSCKTEQCILRQGLPLGTEITAQNGTNELTIICKSTDNLITSSNMVIFTVNPLNETNDTTPQPPAPIQNLQVTSIQNEPSLSLTWSPSTAQNFKAYNVYRRNESFTNIGNIYNVLDNLTYPINISYEGKNLGKAKLLEDKNGVIHAFWKDGHNIFNPSQNKFEFKSNIPDSNILEVYPLLKDDNSISLFYTKTNYVTNQIYFTQFSNNIWSNPVFKTNLERYSDDIIKKVNNDYYYFSYQENGILKLIIYDSFGNIISNKTLSYPNLKNLNNIQEIGNNKFLLISFNTTMYYSIYNSVTNQIESFTNVPLVFETSSKQFLDNNYLYISYKNSYIQPNQKIKKININTKEEIYDRLIDFSDYVTDPLTEGTSPMDFYRDDLGNINLIISSLSNTYGKGVFHYTLKNNTWTRISYNPINYNIYPYVYIISSIVDKNNNFHFTSKERWISGPITRDYIAYGNLIIQSDNPQKITQIQNINQTNYIDQNLNPGMTYYYGVTQTNTNDIENYEVTSVLGTVSGIPVPPQEPEEPFKLQITNPKNNDIFNFTKIPVTYTTDEELESCEYIIDNVEEEQGLQATGVGDYNIKWNLTFGDLYNFYADPIVADLNNDDLKEIIISGKYNNNFGLYLFNSNGTLNKKIDSYAPEDVAVGDINNDNLPEIVALRYLSDTIQIYAYDHSGNLINNFPKHLGATSSNSYPNLVLDDMNNDNRLDIIVSFRTQNSKTSLIAYDNINNNILFNKTFNGHMAPSFSVGDVDNDNNKEIALAYSTYGISGQTFLILLNKNGEIYSNNWPVINVTSSSNYNFNPITMGDVDGNGDLEIVFLNNRQGCLSGKAGVYIYQHTGDLMKYIPQDDCNDVTEGGVVLSDLDNDNDLELIVSSLSSSYTTDNLIFVQINPELYVYHHDGTIFSGFPQSYHDMAFKVNNLVSDIDNDNENEVILLTFDSEFLYGEVSNDRKLNAWNIDGTMSSGFPLNIPKELLGIQSYILSINDIDNNGKLDLLLSGYNVGKTYYVAIELDTPYIPSQNSWEMFRHDPRNTGNFNTILDTSEICTSTGDEDNNGLADCLDPACPESTICSNNNAKSCQSGVCNYRQGTPFNGEVDALEGKNELTLICEATDNNITSSNLVTFFIDTSLPDTTPPSPIQNLQVTQIENQTSVQLTWNHSIAQDFANYNIYRSNEFFGNTDGMVTIAKTTNNSFKDMNLEPGKYYYAVTAVDNKLNENKSVNSIYINVTQFDSIHPTIAMNTSMQSPVYGIVQLTGDAFDNIGLAETCQVCISSDSLCDTEWISVEYNYHFGDKYGACSYSWDTTNFNKTTYLVMMRVSDLSENYGFSGIKLIQVIDEPKDNICIDTELGINFSIKGIVNMTYGNGDNQIFTDYCYIGTSQCYYCENQSGIGVKEYYCDNLTYADEINHICENKCFDGACVIPKKCSDGTLDKTCSNTKPKFCINQTLIDKCSQCGCNVGYFCNLSTDSCQIEPPPQENMTCSNGTPYNACSGNQPKYCEQGNLIDNCIICGCSGDNICSNETSSCELPPPPTVEIQLYAGWNLISLPKIPLDSSIEKVLEPISGKYDSVYSYDPNSKNWLVYRENASIFDSSNNLGNIFNAKAYWIDMTQDATLIINGTDQTSYSTTISQGWNFIGYPYSYEKSINQTFSSLNNKYDIIYTYNNQYKTWMFYSPYESIYENTINNTEPNKGYWIYLYESATWQP